MTPGIAEGDKLLIFKRVSSPSRGDIIALPSPSGAPQMMIRRIIGIPGDIIEIRKGRVFVNDAYLDEPYVSANQNQRERDIGPLRVPDHSYFVMADNRDASFDSRDWGVIPDHVIYGKILMRY